MTKPTTPTGTKRGRLMHTARHGDREQREQAREQLKREVPGKATPYSDAGAPSDFTPITETA